MIKPSRIRAVRKIKRRAINNNAFPVPFRRFISFWVEFQIVMIKELWHQPLFLLRITLSFSLFVWKHKSRFPLKLNSTLMRQVGLKSAVWSLVYYGYNHTSNHPATLWFSYISHFISFLVCWMKLSGSSSPLSPPLPCLTFYQSIPTHPNACSIWPRS
jgi:hypothetical protein